MRTTLISAGLFVASWITLRLAEGPAQTIAAFVIMGAFIGVLVGAVLWIVGATRARREHREAELELLRQIAAQQQPPA